MKKTLDIKKLILLNMPYILLGLFATNFGEAWRMAQGADASEKFLSLVAVLPGALQSFWPSLHPLDLLVGLCCGGSLRLAVYLKSKNAKKYRHGLEYGSARWGTREDIAPYVDPVFQNNVILTKTESLTMNSRPKDPKTARNKNVLVIGGSGSGKTRFWLKPNLMQMHSSYVVTDPKGMQFRQRNFLNLFQLCILAAFFGGKQIIYRGQLYFFRAAFQVSTPPSSDFCSPQPPCRWDHGQKCFFPRR